MSEQAWRTSFHGGHSWPFCDHAKGSLESILTAAAEQGVRVFGVTEHAPRLDARLLYPDEREWGWTVETLEEKFTEYFETLNQLIPAFAGDLEVLRGFEIEVVPGNEWPAIMREYRERYDAEYIVGSVHYVGGHSIDSFVPEFEEALRAYGGLEALTCAYYEQVAEMVDELRPEIVGHLDLIRKIGHKYGDVDTPAARSAARVALQEIKHRGGILDLNTAALRRGFAHPYPAPWLVEEARALGIPFAFGDDSHQAAEVNAGVDQARQYLLDHGIDEVMTLRRDPEGGPLLRRPVSIALTETELDRRAFEAAKRASREKKA